MVEAPGFVGLAEVIRQVRGELEQAREDGEGQSLGFAVEKVSLEFTVQVHRSGAGRGGLRIGVVTAELSGSADRGTTHRIQVELTPETAENGRYIVSRDGRPSGTGHS
jgi:hypothetical protein